MGYCWCWWLYWGWWGKGASLRSSHKIVHRNWFLAAPFSTPPRRRTRAATLSGKRWRPNSIASANSTAIKICSSLYISTSPKPSNCPSTAVSPTTSPPATVLAEPPLPLLPFRPLLRLQVALEAAMVPPLLLGLEGLVWWAGFCFGSLLQHRWCFSISFESFVPG